MNMNKRGSHVGIILSFVIFVTFIIFLYSALQPSMNLEGGKQAMLDFLKKEFLNKMIGDMTELRVRIDEVKITSKCVKLTGLQNKTGIGKKIIVKNENNEKRKYYIERNGDLSIDRKDLSETFFKIYYSEEFMNENSAVSSPCNPADEAKKEYTLGNIRTKEYIFQSLLKKMMDDYEVDYDSVKEMMKVPPGNDFGFSFKNSTGGIIKTGDVDKQTNVYAEEISVNYVDQNANVLPGFISINVW